MKVGIVQDTQKIQKTLFPEDQNISETKTSNLEIFRQDSEIAPKIDGNIDVLSFGERKTPTHEPNIQYSPIDE